MDASRTPNVVTFGAYEIRLSTQEVLKHGRRIKLQPQAFQVLQILLERPGQLVSREDLCRSIWSADTFVDFDHALNNAVKKIRDALSDSAETPRYVETLPRLGYRFIGQLNETACNQVPATIPVLDVATNPHTSRWSAGRLRLIAALVAFLVGFSVFKWQGLWRGHATKPQIKSLAVLPLENLSGDAAQEYFADGMTDEVITRLAKNPALRVISRTSVMQYKHVHRPLREIAQELGVDGILEGSVGRSGNRIHLTAQLIYAASDTHVWAESFERDLSDVNSLQNELAQTIAKQVGATTSGLRYSGHRIDPKAHDAYLLGRYYWFAYENERSTEYFRKAIDLQPDYAAAWSGLADSYALSAALGRVPPDAVMPQAEAAAKKALELDDLSAEAHNTMAALYLAYRWNWIAAERESLRALELNPNLGEAHHLYAKVLVAFNRTDEELEEEKRAMELDPFARPWALGESLLNARRYDEALADVRARSEAQPKNADLHFLLSDAYLYKKMERQAEQERQRGLRLSGEQKLADEEQQSYVRAGFKSVLEENLNKLKQRAAKRYVSPMDLADAYGALGRKEETLLFLERAYEEHAPWMIQVQSRPHFDFVHSDPRYRAIIKKMNLPPAY